MEREEVEVDEQGVNKGFRSSRQGPTSASKASRGQTGG
jgi:hypothetical protein